jgi:ABC-type multidrug transport system ATPase subunit
VSHSDYLYDRLTPLETLRTWSRLLGRGASDELLLEMLREVDLERYRDYPVGGFSAGMRKRLTLLRTRLEEPRIVLLDEPFSALDAAGKRLVEAWIDSFRSRGMTVIMASHALERAHRLVDRAILLDQGQIVWMGDPGNLMRQIEGPS